MPSAPRLLFGVMVWAEQADGHRMRIADETVFDVLAVDRAMGMPGAILRAEARALRDLLGGQHKINSVRIGRQRAARQGLSHDMLHRGIGQRRALAAGYP